MTILGRARVAAASVPGCRHVLAGGAPCQDASATLASRDAVILAIADGHGDEAYTHSDDGARIAVAVALEVLSAVTRRITTESLDARAFDLAIAAPMRRRLAFEWNRRAKHHKRMVSLRDENASLWPDGVTGDWDEAVRPYGCTLVAAAITTELAIWLRLGDGEALVVDDAGVRRVFRAADKSMGEATQSFCMRDAAERIEIVVTERAPLHPCELAVLATDGVCDQYDEDPSFEVEWGSRMLERIRTKGWVETAMELPRYLGVLARDGDDCSAVLAWFPPKEDAS